MLVHNHHPDRLMTPQSLSRGGEAWMTAVVPRLPANLAEQARELQAFPRVRGIATPHDLWRGLLADVLGPLLTRRLGAWAVLSGLADIAEAALRKRLRARNDWLLWLVGARRAVSEAPAPSVPQWPAVSWWSMRAVSGHLAGRALTGGSLWPTIGGRAGPTRGGARIAGVGHTWRGIRGQPAR